MDYRTFKHVLDMTEHGMQRHYLQSERAGGYVSPEAQLAFTIRWLSGGSYLDIADHYDVSKATFYRLVYECIDLIIGGHRRDSCQNSVQLRQSRRHARRKSMVFFGIGMRDR
jgi:hypothetical protein